MRITVLVDPNKWHYYGIDHVMFSIRRSRCSVNVFTQKNIQRKNIWENIQSNPQHYKMLENDVDFR